MMGGAVPTTNVRVKDSTRIRIINVKIDSSETIDDVIQRLLRTVEIPKPMIKPRPKDVSSSVWNGSRTINNQEKRSTQ